MFAEATLAMALCRAMLPRRTPCCALHDMPRRFDATTRVLPPFDILIADAASKPLLDAVCAACCLRCCLPGTICYAAHAHDCHTLPPFYAAFIILSMLRTCAAHGREMRLSAFTVRRALRAIVVAAMPFALFYAMFMRCRQQHRGAARRLF